MILALVLVTGLAARAGDAAVTNQGNGELVGPFGIGSSQSSSNHHDKWIPRMAAIGIRTLRSTGHIGYVGSQPTSWDDRPASWDGDLNYLAAQNFSTGETLYSYRPGKHGFPMDDLPGWSQWVSAVVGHAKGKVKYWEVWNEPPNGTRPEQTAADYAKLVVATHDAAKAANPDCLVGLAAKSVDVNYLEQAIKAGAKDHFDYITLHPYESLGTAMNVPGAEALFMNIVPTVRKMLAAQNPAKANVPVIFTEIGYDSRNGAKLQADAVVKTYAMGIAQGVACIQWFEGMDGDSGPLGLLQADGTPRPAYTALAQMIKCLGEHPAPLGWVLLNGKGYGFVFKGAQANVLVAWAPKGTAETINFGQPVSLVDPLTGAVTQADSATLTDSPTIVNGVPNNLVKQAQDNQGKPFPWDGDYTGAKSVSVTFGQTNLEKGLHTQSAATVAADVIRYGGSARAGSVPGGNVFMVDPNFLTYASTPIGITVVVRRNAANDNAGFSLKYESTTGQSKSCGWYTVPDNKQWHTMTWRITDAQFVGMYGYSFTLDSDGSRFNKYDIQSVTVTKLDQ
jgi:hypothetical protein